MYMNGGVIPDKADEQVFCGRYTHRETIDKTLEFLEFIICQA